MKKSLAILALSFIVVVALTESAYWFGYLNQTAIFGGEAGNCIVLVLGYPTKSDGSLHPVQRFRVETGVAVYRAHQCKKIVFSGGAVSNQNAEAESMAALARTIGVPEKDIIVEGHSRTTWENIGCSAPFLKAVNRVIIASDSLHVHRAKTYACRQNASLCPKVFTLGAVPPATLLWWMVPAAAHELYSRLRDLFLYERGVVSNGTTCPVR